MKATKNVDKATIIVLAVLPLACAQVRTIEVVSIEARNGVVQAEDGIELTLRVAADAAIPVGYHDGNTIFLELAYPEGPHPVWALLSMDEGLIYRATLRFPVSWFPHWPAYDVGVRLVRHSKVPLLSRHVLSNTAAVPMGRLMDAQK